ncbi:NAD(P)/FAD-dependent oxidoreductase [Salinarimonas rosea]|uniref:NAD(P)/FAD-dependent oxidoreductase n=1 Tax=Salinarimonas rosea TaxID=552063 RepID=UPI00041488FC|nr:NAD(P)/FAD-dependent oxidoreductase [Salinarimonas rosea]
MDILVIGAGIVGLAIARSLSRRGHAVVVAERTAGIGGGISSRNSEVVHAGLYYPTGSLKARHCVAGRRMLYAYCAERGVPARRLGKLVVATSEAEIGKLEAIRAQGEANDVEELALIPGEAARAMEPALACTAALHSPQTGIVDSHALMLALQGEMEDNGGALALATPIERLAFRDGAWEVTVAGEAHRFDAVVNAAALGAQAIARATEGYPEAAIPPLRLAKGTYFACAGRPAFGRLIYPAPVDGGLGVHLTLDLAGRMRFGPDVEWIEAEDYDVDPMRSESFYAAIRRYWPALPDGALTADYCGIRPKLSGPGEPAADFVVADETAHGLPRHVALFGIESPGLTSALSLGEAVADALATG